MLVLLCVCVCHYQQTNGVLGTHNDSSIIRISLDSVDHLLREREREGGREGGREIERERERRGRGR